MLIRKIKIHKFVPVLTKKELEIVNFIENKLSDLKIYQYDKQDEFSSLYYGNNKNECIFRINFSSRFIWIKDKNFWEILKNKYLMEEKDIQSLLYYYIKNLYKDRDISQYVITWSNRIIIPTELSENELN